MKFDMHVHTVHSDGDGTVRELVKQAIKTGLSGFAITDHDTVKAHKQIRRIKGLIVIPGQEISTSEGHVLGYLINEAIPKGLSVEETIRKIKEQGGIAVAAHPYAPRLGVKNFKNYGFHAYEEHNTYSSYDYTTKKILETRTSLPRTAGSDAHITRMLGSAYVESPKVNSAEELVRQILRNKTTTHANYLSIKEHVRMIKEKDGNPIPEIILSAAYSVQKRVFRPVHMIRLRNY